MSVDSGASITPSEEATIPKRRRPLDEDTPPEPEPIPEQIREAIKKSNGKRKELKEKRLKERKEQRNGVFSHRHESLLREAAGKEEQARIAMEKEQIAAQYRARKTVRPEDKGSDWMSWTVHADDSQEDVPNTPRPTKAPTEFPVWDNNYYNPYFAGFPPKTPAFPTEQGFSFSPTEFPHYASFGGFNTQDESNIKSEPLSDDFEYDRDATPQPEDTPTPRASPEPQASRHCKYSFTVCLLI